MISNFNNGAIFQIISPKSEENIDKSACYMLTVEGCSETAPLREWCNKVFGSL